MLLKKTIDINIGNQNNTEIVHEKEKIYDIVRYLLNTIHDLISV